MENNIALYGASGHSKVIIEALESNKEFVSIVVDDNKKINEILRIKILQPELVDFTKFKVIVAIGNNIVRKNISHKLQCIFHTVIHEKSIVSKRARILEGTVVMAGVIINCDVEIGKHCIINSGAVIEHDCQISDFSHISPNASLAGNVIVGEGTHIGIGATVIQGIKIGKWVTIGAGSVVLKDIPDYATVVGNPGKIINYKMINE